MTAAPRACSPETPQDSQSHDWRCWRCGRLLARLLLFPGSRIEVKCRDCKAMNVAQVDKDKATA